MAISFTRVPGVTTGSAITSEQLGKIADAFNDRLRSGLADGPWRIAFYMMGLFRQIRNSDESGFIFPPQAEFFYSYQNLRPDEKVWPMATPGDPEGVNVANVLGGFVYGVEGLDLFSEDLRVADEMSGGVPLWLGLTIPSTPEQLWTLGKLQRGAYDPVTGYMASPSLRAAQEHFKLQPSTYSPHGNSWGGYMPAPAEGPGCSDAQFINFEVFFSNLHDGSVSPTYQTCPDDPSHYRIFRGSNAYYVLRNDGGEFVVYPIKDWIEGPYSGGAWVMRQPGVHIPRVLNAFTADFRGTEAQREAQTSWLAHAFDIQGFLTKQYHLAPNKGSVDEFSGAPTYPRFLASGSTFYPAGTIVKTWDGLDGHFYELGFVATAVFVKLTGFAGTATLEFLESGDPVLEMVCQADEDGNFSAIRMFEAPAQMLPLSVRWKTDATFTSGGTVEIEATELMEYKPELSDLYLCLRLGSCRTSLSSGMDGSGTDETSADLISDSYFENGCITNVHGSPGPAGELTAVNSNAVFDAARRLSQCVRMVPRHQFIGYELDGAGRSVCYFRRIAPGGNDLFEGIAPKREEIFTGGIEPGRVYIVRSGVVTYREVVYVTGQTFTGVHPTVDFEGDGHVFEHEGIYHTAPRAGMTNEWLMGHQLHVYHPNDESIWKPEAYSDYWFFTERCHLDTPDLSRDLKMQFNYGSNLSYFPESPTGWRYVKNTNRMLCDEEDTDCQERRVNRYKSCRIYEPDPEIFSATVLIEGGEEIVKLVYAGRFHHCDTATSSIARDVSTWNTTDLQAEPYRTMENGLREYLVWANQGKHCSPGAPLNLGQQGNAAVDATIWGLTDNPHGSCFPSFYFVKLFPKAYEDANNTQDPHDTPLMADWWILADLYLRAMVEGYVDERTSETIVCDAGINAMFDYTFESACFEAFGGRWFNTLATEETSVIERPETRGDKPQGFGQLPNTTPAAEIYNQVAGVLNLLTKVRVMLPMSFQTRSLSGLAQTPVTGLQNDRVTPLDCSEGIAIAGLWTGTPPDPGAASPGDWEDSFGVSSGVGAQIDCFECDGTNFLLTVSRTDMQWRWNYTDPDAQHAVPETWRDMVQTEGRMLAFRTETVLQDHVAIAADFDDATKCDALGIWFDGTNYLKFIETAVVNTSACVTLSNSGSISAAGLGKNDLAIGRAPDGTTCCAGVSSSINITPILGDDTAYIQIPLA